MKCLKKKGEGSEALGSRNRISITAKWRDSDEILTEGTENSLHLLAKTSERLSQQGYSQLFENLQVDPDAHLVGPVYLEEISDCLRRLRGLGSTRTLDRHTARRHSE